MTIIEDAALQDLLHRAGAEFTIPESGMDDILDRAVGRPAVPEQEEASGRTAGEGVGRDAPPSVRMLTTMRSHRLLVGAACLVVAVAIAAGVGWISKAPTTRTAAGSAPLGSGPSKATPSNSGAAGPGAKGAATTTAATTTATAGRVAAPSGSSSSLGLAHAPSNAGSGSVSKAAASPTASHGDSSTATSPPALINGDVGQSSKIEQTGSLSLVVPKGATSKTMSELTFLAGAYNGFVVSSQTQAVPGDKGSTLAGSITLQVPVASFATVLKKAQALGKTSTLSTKATDVTGQYVDLQSQITAAQASLQQYLTIMTKATTIGDVLSVQAQINTIQSQIQQLQGQLQVLTSETTYSTLTVQVNETVPPVPVIPVQPQSGVAKAWHDSVHGFGVAVDGLIRVGGPALFALACAGVILIGGRFAWRRYRRAKL